MLRSRVLPCVLLGAAGLGVWSAPAVQGQEAAPEAEAKDEPKPQSTEEVRRAPTLSAQHTRVQCFHEVGEALTISGNKLTFERVKGSLRIGGDHRATLDASGSIALRAGKGKTNRKLAIHFLRSPPPPHAAGDEPATGAVAPPTWYAANLTARAVKIGEDTVHLIDTDLDGRYDEFGKDGLALPGNPMVIPLPRRFVLGRQAVEFTWIAGNGGTVTVKTKPIEGTEKQLQALEQINGYRWDMGLPPVQLDPQLSAACTAHATYLEKNGWSGYSDPHAQDPEKPGHTEEGAAVARRAVIMQARTRYALDSFWRSYYHRIDLMDPSLEFVGINTEPHWIVVIDAKKGVGDWDVVDAGWSDPILCPADGQTGFPTNFCRRGEAPSPVSRASARGNPLMVSFTMDDRIITKFRASLVRLTPEGAELGVEVMSANQRHAVHVFGAVPRAPLAPDTQYRVTFHYEANGKPETRTATFRTAP